MDAVTLFAMEQNLLAREQRWLRFLCGCAARASYLRSWDEEAWLIVTWVYETSCGREHGASDHLYLTKELVAYQAERLSQNVFELEPVL